MATSQSPIMDSVMIDENDLRDASENLAPEIQRGEQDVNSNNSGFKITMDKVTPRTDGLTSYTIYRIFTETTHKDFKNPQVEAWRRYSDFLWVYNKLKSNNKSCLVPTLPEKDYLGKNDHQVTEYRRRELARFLNRVTKHHILRNDKALRDFLEASDQEMVFLRNQGDGSETASTTQTTEPNQSSSFSFFGLWKPAPTVVYQEKDSWFETIENFYESLEHQMNVTSRTLHSFTIKTRDYSAIHNDICLQFGLLKETESKQDESLSLSLARFADAAKSMTVAFDDLGNTYKTDLEDAISDHYRMIKAIRELLKYRTQLFSDYENTCSSLQSKRSRADDIFQTETEAERKKKLAEESSQNIKKEIEEFQRIKALEIKTAITNIISANLTQFSNMHKEWEGVHQELARDFDQDS